MRVVIDTNVLVSGLMSISAPPHRIVRAIRNRQLAIVVTPSVVHEYQRVLFRPKLARLFPDTDEPASLLAAITGSSVRVTPLDSLPVSVRDPNDEMFLAAALAGADALVTGDDDLLTLANDPAIAPLRILSPRDFLVALDCD